MSYTSDIKLEIGEVPKTTDNNQLPDMIDIFNSIHILAQYVDQLIKTRNEENDPDGKTPAELRPPKQLLIGQIGADCVAGNLLTMYDLGDDELYWMPGGPAWGYRNKTSREVIGIALEDGNAYDFIKIAVGPAVLQLTGATQGKFYYLNSALIGTSPRANAGYMYEDPQTDGVNAPVAQGIAADYVMVFGEIIWHEGTAPTP